MRIISEEAFWVVSALPSVSGESSFMLTDGGRRVGLTPEFPLESAALGQGMQSLMCASSHKNFLGKMFDMMLTFRALICIL